MRQPVHSASTACCVAAPTLEHLLFGSMHGRDLITAITTSRSYGTFASCGVLFSASSDQALNDPFVAATFEIKQVAYLGGVGQKEFT
jgi:hypothetical protein